MSLSNFDIIKICKKLKINLIGTFFKDELPQKVKKGNYIINLQSSTQGDGTHWLALVLDDNKCFYFDSFGEPAPIEIEAFIKKFYQTGQPGKADCLGQRPSYAYNNFEIQNLTSDLCGYYCIGLYKYLANDKLNENLYKDCNSYINLFQQNTKLNGNILKNYLSSLDIKGN